MSRVKEQKITDLSSDKRKLIEKRFNGETKKFIFHFQLPEKYSSIGENINGKLHGRAIVNTEDYVFVGNFDNGNIISGIAHYKDDASHKCHVLNYKTIIHVCDNILYMIHVYNIDEDNVCRIISLYMSYDSLIIHTNTRVDGKTTVNPNQLLEIGLDYVNINSPIFGFFNEKRGTIPIKIVPNVNNSDVSKLYKAYTNYNFKPLLHVHLNVISDEIINVVQTDISFIDSIYDLCVNNIGIQQYEEGEYNYYDYDDGYRDAE